MPVVIAWIGEALLSVAGQIALTVLVSVGIGIVSRSAASGLIDSTGIRSAFSAAGPLIPYIGWFGIDTAITIYLSAWAGRAIVDAARIQFVKRGSTTGAS